MSEQIYQRCHHVTPNGRHMRNSRPGIPHPIDGWSLSDICYGYVSIDEPLYAKVECTICVDSYGEFTLSNCGTCEAKGFTFEQFDVSLEEPND